MQKQKYAYLYIFSKQYFSLLIENSAPGSNESNLNIATFVQFKSHTHGTSDRLAL